MKPSLRFSLLFTALVLYSAPRAFAGAVDYRYSATMTVAGAAEDVSLANFPVLVRISPARIAGFAYAQLASPQDGADLRFLDANGHFVNHDIDTWNTNGESLVWVTVPTLAQGASLTMLWGNSSPAEANSPATVWSAANYTVVLHCGDTSTTAVDAAGHYNGTLDAMSAPAADGIVGAATTATTDTSASGNNSGGGIVLEGTAGQHLGNLTLSGWFRHADIDIAGDIAFARRPGAQSGGDKDGYFSYFGADGKFTGRAESYYNDRSAATALADGEWVHVAMLGMGGSYKWYITVNGVDAGVEGSNRLRGDGNFDIAFGQNPQRTGRAFHGEMDELRIRNATRNTAWVAEEYATVANDGYLTYGAAGDAGTEYVAFLRLNGSDTLPAEYGEPDATFSQINEAVDAALAARANGKPKATVYVAPGTYPVSAPLWATNAVNVIGLGAPEDVFITCPASSAGRNWKYRLLAVQGGRLENVTVGDVTTTWISADYGDGNLKAWGAALLLNGAGTVASNIVVRGVNATSDYAPNNHFRGVVGVQYGAVLTDSRVINNTGSLAGGGIYAGDVSAVIRCVISNNVNTAVSSAGDAGRGGGVFLRDRASLVDCLIAGNTAGKFGGGVCHLGYQGTGHGILNCTISGNSTDGQGGGVYAQETGECVNTIVWGNTAAGVADAVTVVTPSGKSYPLRSCCLETAVNRDGATGNFTATDTVSANPRFRAPAKGDYRLDGSSPCIDAAMNFDAWRQGLGRTATWIALNGAPHCHDDPTDTFAGLPDIGCYESTYWSNRPMVVMLR